MDAASGHSQTPPVPAGPPTAAAAQFPPKSSAAAAAANPTTAPLRRQVFAAPRASTAPNSTAMAPPKTKGPRPAAKPKAAGSKRPAASSASVPSATAPPQRSRKKAAVGRGKQPAATMDSSGQFVVTPPPPPPPPVIEGPATPYTPPADRNVVDEMTQSVDDETFLQSMHVGPAGYMSQDTPSQEYETQVEDEEEEDEDVLAEEGLDLDDEGFLDEAPRTSIAQGLFKGKPKKGKRGKKGKGGKTFTLHHCWSELENDEKWKNRDLYEVPKKSGKSSVGDAYDDEASSEEGRRSPTPNSVAKTKRPNGRKYAKEKGKKTRDDDIKKSLDAIMNVRKEMAEDRKMMKQQEMEALRVAEDRKAAAEERRAAAEERLAAAEDRKVAMEEKKAAMEEARRAEEREDKLMFMDTSGMSDKQKQYIELCPDQLLSKKQMMGYMHGMAGGMGGAMPGMGGYMQSLGSAMGRGMPGMGAYMGGIGGGMGAFMSGDMGASMGGGMGASMGGGIPSNTTHVNNHGNGGETPKEDGNNNNGGNGDTVVVEP